MSGSLPLHAFTQLQASALLWLQIWGGFQQVSKWKVCKWMRQTAWPYLCSLFPCWIHVHMGLCHVFPVNPQTWDSARAGFSSKGCCSWSSWLHCWYSWVSFVLGKGGKLPWQDTLKNSLVWCFGHKCESEPVSWALSHDLPDAVSVCSWYLLGSLRIHIHIPMEFHPTWYFCLSSHSAVFLQPRHP